MLLKQLNFYKYTLRTFTGKTETGFKFTTPKMRMKSITPVFPPPGDNLQIPGINNLNRMVNQRFLR
jgi:hypothetical protein